MKRGSAAMILYKQEQELPLSIPWSAKRPKYSHNEKETENYLFDRTNVFSNVCSKVDSYYQTSIPLLPKSNKTTPSPGKLIIEECFRVPFFFKCVLGNDLINLASTCKTMYTWLSKKENAIRILNYQASLRISFIKNSPSVSFLELLKRSTSTSPPNLGNFCQWVKKMLRIAVRVLLVPTTYKNSVEYKTESPLEWIRSAFCVFNKGITQFGRNSQHPDIKYISKSLTEFVQYVKRKFESKEIRNLILRKNRALLILSQKIKDSKLLQRPVYERRYIITQCIYTHLQYFGLCLNMYKQALCVVQYAQCYLLTAASKRLKMRIEINKKEDCMRLYSDPFACSSRIRVDFSCGAENHPKLLEYTKQQILNSHVVLYMHSIQARDKSKNLAQIAYALSTWIKEHVISNSLVYGDQTFAKIQKVIIEKHFRLTQTPSRHQNTTPESTMDVAESVQMGHTLNSEQMWVEAVTSSLTLPGNRKTETNTLGGGSEVRTSNITNMVNQYSVESIMELVKRYQTTTKIPISMFTDKPLLKYLDVTSNMGLRYVASSETPTLLGIPSLFQKLRVRVRKYFSADKNIQLGISKHLFSLVPSLNRVIVRYGAAAATTTTTTTATTTTNNQNESNASTDNIKSSSSSIVFNQKFDSVLTDAKGNVLDLEGKIYDVRGNFDPECIFSSPYTLPFLLKSKLTLNFIDTKVKRLVFHVHDYDNLLAESSSNSSSSNRNSSSRRKNRNGVYVYHSSKIGNLEIRIITKNGCVFEFPRDNGRGVISTYTRTVESNLNISMTKIAVVVKPKAKKST